MLQPTGDLVRKTTNAFELRPGVIVDPDRPAVYLMNPRGGIDAVDLSSGTLIWTTAQAAKPLLLYDDLLVAQAEVSGRSGVLRIVWLNTKDMDRAALKADVELPDGVSASIDDGLGTSFRASADMHAGTLIVSWRSSMQYISGAAPPPDVTALDRQAAGVVRIEPKTGGVESLTSGEVSAPPAPRLPDNVARLVESGALPGPLWHAGNVLATITRANGGDSQRVILRRWDRKTGKPLPEVTLANGGLTFRFAAADSRHLLASRQVEAGREKYLWVIFSLETGARVAEVLHHLSAAAFFLSDSSLVYESLPSRQLIDGKWVEEPLSLQAIELKTGAELWGRPVRDTAYRGPYPPAVPGRSGPSLPPASPGRDPQVVNGQGLNS